MSLKIAVVGIRHGHINDLIARLREHPHAQLVAVCEEDETAREALSGNAALSEYSTPVPIYDSYAKLLEGVECDAIGIGDYYGIRGRRALTALQHGKHIISDKPLCTALCELDEIETLAREKGLSVGCQLDMRSNGALRRLRRMIAEGELGEIVAISFGGQHPLLYGTRAGWYFEEGKHGGTINDIAIHALDLLPWLLGKQVQTINAARNWNARLPQVPHFKDAAQMMLTLDNGAGVLGDVSYCAPDSHGYTFPLYWRITVWGDGGVAEFENNTPTLKLYKNGESGMREVEPDASAPGEYLEAFLQEVQGEQGGALTTEEVVRSARLSLLVQNAADKNLTDISVA